MEKTIAILTKKEDIERIPPNTNLVISPTEEIDKLLKIRNINFSQIQVHKTPDSNKRAIYWLKKWSDRKLLNNKNFKELINYRGISLWWFSDFWFYYHTVHKNTIQNIIHHCETIQNIIEKENPNKIILFGEETLFNQVTRLATKTKNISLEIIENPLREKIKYFAENKKPCMLEFLREKKFTSRSFLSKLKKYKVKQSEKKLSITTYSSLNQYSTDHLSGKSKKQDIIFGQIIDNLKDKLDIQVSDIDYTPSPKFNQIKNNIPFEHYYNKKIKEKVKCHKRILKKQWILLNKNKKFQDSLTYNGISLWPLLENKFKFFFLNRCPEAIKYIETSINLIKSQKPKAVFTVDETSLFARSVIVAAKSNKIPVLGIQHGLIIQDESFEYTHLNNEIHPTLTPRSPYCPIPDLTFIYGNYTKQVLENFGNYPEKSIKITGQPRYDFLPRINKLFKKEEVYKEFNLDPTKKLVLFTTEALESEEAGDLNNTVLKGIKKLENVNLIIKLHPREFEEQYYKKLAKKHNLTSKVIRDYNTFKLLHACDAVIVMHSTVGLEAAMIDKPIVMVNISGNPDVVQYVKDGIAVGAYKQSEVAPAIEKVLFEKETQEKLNKKRTAYVKENIHSTDGKATERICKEILKIFDK
jgi:UDP-N-acetylglucosamine 2-epimerase